MIPITMCVPSNSCISNNTYLTNNTCISNNTCIHNNTTTQPRLQIYEYFEVTLIIIGAISNLVTFYIFKTHRQKYSRSLLILLKHQSVIDFLVCVTCIIRFVESYNWMTGFFYFDTFICHMWHSQFLFWYFSCISIWNLVLVSLERFLAVCHPLKYYMMSQNSITRKSIVLIYVISCLNVMYTMFQYKLIRNSCIKEYISDNPAFVIFITIMSFIYLLIYYVVPIMTFIIVYLFVLMSMRKRKDTTCLGYSKTIRSATKGLTTSTLCVTAFCTCLLGYGTFSYLISLLNISKYPDNDSTLNRFCIFLVALNSSCNMLIYTLSMPVFRSCVKALLPNFSVCKSAVTKKETSNHIYVTRL